MALRMPEDLGHLDTVMTIEDPNTFTKYAGLGMLPAYRAARGQREELHVTDHEPAQTHDAIAAALGRPSWR